YLYLDRFGPLLCMTIPAAVTISSWIFRFIKCFFPYIGYIWPVHRVTPAEELIVANRWKWRAEERCTRHVPPFVAMDMPFVELSNSKEWLVRINEQHGVPGNALTWANHPHIRTLSFRETCKLIRSRLTAAPNAA